MSWFWALLALLLAIELVAPAYFLAMRARARRLPRSAARAPEQWPHVTVIVATYNEGATIRGRLENLREHDYPRFDVLVVDSASTDDTRALVREFQQEHPEFPVRLIEEPARRGKVVALRAAIPQAQGDVVCLTDADCAWAPDALRAAVARLASDPRIGAVTGVQTLLDGDGLAQGMEEGYNAFYNALRQGESHVDSTPIFQGSLTLFRRDLIDVPTLGSEAARADDSEIAMMIRKRGYRTVAEPASRFLEFAPPTVGARRRQKARRGVGLLELFLHNAPVALKPWRYGRFSLICLANLLILLVAPVATVALAVLVPYSAWLLGGAPLVLALAAAGALVVATARFAPRSLAGLAVGYLESHLALLRSITMLARREASWDPITEVRQRWREQRAA